MRDSYEKQLQYYELGEHYFWLAAHYDISFKMLEPILAQMEGGNGSRKLRILDAGCGPGNFISRLTEKGEIIGMDFSLDALSFCVSKHNAPVLSGDMEQMPFADNTLDFIVALETLEHVEDDIQALKELYRVLKPGGGILISVPAFMSLWGDHDKLYGHFRRYERSELIERIQAVGFSIDTCLYVKCLFFLPLFLLRKFKGVIRRDHPPQDDFYKVPQWLNSFFRWLIVAEAISGFNRLMPFGTTLIASFCKPALGAH